MSEKQNYNGRGNDYKYKEENYPADFFSLNKTLSIKGVKITAAATIRKIAAGKTKPTINRKKVEIL